MNVLLRCTVMCLGLSLLGCEQPQAIKNMGLIYCAERAPRTLNPQVENSHEAIALSSRHVYNRLIDINPITQQLEPGLAKSWQRSDDGLSYTFTLRQGVKFHHTDYFEPSRDLNAEDVAFSFLRIIDESHPYHSIGEGYPFFETTRFTDNVVNIEVLNDVQIRFDLQRPDASFIASMASDFAVVLSAEYGEQLLEELRPSQLDFLPIGTGPFLYANQQDGHFLRYYHHPYYWQGIAPMRQLVFDITPTSSARMAKLLAGQCDIMAQPAATQIEVIKQREDLLISLQAGLNVSYLAFNTQRPPFADVRMRRTIAASIDKYRLKDAVYQQTAQIANSVLSPSSWAHRNQPPREYSADLNADFVEQARQNPITLWVLGTPTSFNPQPQRSAEVIRNELSQLGFQVEVRLLDWAVLRTQLQQEQPNYDLLLIGAVSENTDPDTFFRQQFSCDGIENGFNFSRWCNGRFDDMLEQASQAGRLAERVKFYFALQELLEDEVPVLPLTHAIKMYAYNDSLTDIGWHAFGGISFDEARRR